MGGSLLHSKTLLNWLESIQQYAQHNHVVIVPGGGEFADRVRDLQQQVKFNEQTAHRLALLAMFQYGYLLAGLNPAIQIVDDIGKLVSEMDKQLPLLWLPNCLLDDFSGIPASWDYTSDSVALWLANKLMAKQLILVKSIFMNSPESSLEQLIGNGVIDKGFQRLTGDYSGKILWFEQSQFHLLNQANSIEDKSLEIHF